MMSEDYPQKALEAVALTVNKQLDVNPAMPFFPANVTHDDFYVVWFVKVLQNWKALVSTDLVLGQYFEVTYNGDRLETYVDWYEKQSNTLVPDVMLTDPFHIHLTD